MKIPMKSKNIILFLFAILSLPALAQEEGLEIYTRAVDQLLNGQIELSLDIQDTDQKGRVKEKSYDILMASFGDVEKIRMLMLKPERAKGITVVITNRPEEIGQIEIYTPANGKIRKMKATPENMERVGSNFFLSGFASQNPDNLNIRLVGEQEVEGTNCYRLQVSDEAVADSSKAEFMVDKGNFQFIRIDFFDEKGTQTHLTTLGEYQIVEGAGGKIQPMLISAEDLAANTQTTMQVIQVSLRQNISEEEFILQETEVVEYIQ